MPIRWSVVGWGSIVWGRVEWGWGWRWGGLGWIGLGSKGPILKATKQLFLAKYGWVEWVGVQQGAI